MLSIPYTAPNGDTLSIRFRRLQGDGPKYLTAPGDKPRLFNTPAVERYSDIMCITEGEFDTMILSQAGLPAMGVPGAQAWKKEWFLILKPYRTIYIFVDGDDPGRKFGQMIAEKLSNARIIELGDGMDVSSFYLENDADAILRKVK
jgi:DNA primase